MISEVKVDRIYIIKTDWSGLVQRRKTYQNKTNGALEWSLALRQNRGNEKWFSSMITHHHLPVALRVGRWYESREYGRK